MLKKVSLKNSELWTLVEKGLVKDGDAFDSESNFIIYNKDFGFQDFMDYLEGKLTDASLTVEDEWTYMFNVNAHKIVKTEEGFQLIPKEEGSDE